MGFRSSGRRQARGAVTTRVASVAMTVATALGPVAAAAPGPIRGDFDSPLAAPPQVATPFDRPARPWLPGHRGVDLAAPPLAEVRAPAGGRVLFAGHVAGRPVLSIVHGGGLRTTYEPVRATVREGDEVTSGQPVGHLYAGHPGCPLESCLHWGARVAAGGPSGDDDEYLDPMGLLTSDARPIRLKPLRSGDGGA